MNSVKATLYSPFQFCSVCKVDWLAESAVTTAVSLGRSSFRGDCNSASTLGGSVAGTSTAFCRYNNEGMLMWISLQASGRFCAAEGVSVDTV